MGRNSITRRRFLESAATAVLAETLVACNRSSRDPKKRNVKIAVNGYASNATKRLISDLGFTRQTGIEAEVLVRPTSTNEFITQMISGIYAGTSPYDVIDFEDEAAVALSRPGWLLGLDDLLPTDFWADFPRPMLDMTEVWGRHNGETFRIHHNFEPSYWWYRKDWFENKGLAVPTSWSDVKALGEVFTDEAKGVWASEEGMVQGGLLNVYIAWVTKQAGGNPFEVAEPFSIALEYIYDLMYKNKVLNPASLQKGYDQQNADYLADRVAFMRQHPFFYDVSRAKTGWYSAEKVGLALPPVGSGGKAESTYATGWGYGIPKTAPNLSEAKELLKFLVDKRNASQMVSYSTWFLSARHSVLGAAGDKETAKYLKMYTDAGVVSTRPFHPNFVEATAIIEDAASAFLTNQVNLSGALSQARERLAHL